MPSREYFIKRRRDKFIEDVKKLYLGINGEDPRAEIVNIRNLHIKKVAHLVYALLSPCDESMRNKIINKIKELLEENET